MLQTKHNLMILAFALCLLLLAGCGKTAAPTQTPPEAAETWWEPEDIPAVAGEEREPPEEPEGPTDGLEGSYYNDYLRETLILDGRGGCSVSWPGGVMGGFYSLTDDGSLAVLLSDLRLTVRFDGGGDLSIDRLLLAYSHPEMADFATIFAEVTEVLARISHHPSFAGSTSPSFAGSTGESPAV